jgi:hypothetical protein
VRSSIALLLLVACDSVPQMGGTTSISDTGPEQGVWATWTGTNAGSGFGARIAVSESSAWVAAPFAAPQVFLLRGSGDPLLVHESDPGSFLGIGMAALSDGTLALGAPGQEGGRLVTGNPAVEVASGNGVGGVVAAEGNEWVTSTADGWLRSDGATGSFGRRPDALALADDGTVYAGFAWGDLAFAAGTTRREPRAEVDDEAGFAITVCTNRDSGSVYAVVGLPGAGIMAWWDGRDLQPIGGPGLGRFGASIACNPADSDSFYVGAPASGDNHAGAVYRYNLSGDGTRVLEGEEGDEMGWALAAIGDTLFVGSPGFDGGRGRVQSLPLP